MSANDAKRLSFIQIFIAFCMRNELLSAKSLYLRNHELKQKNVDSCNNHQELKVEYFVSKRYNLIYGFLTLTKYYL